MKLKFGFIIGIVMVTVANAQTKAPEPNPGALSVVPEAIQSKKFTGQSVAIIYDIPTGTQTRVSLDGDDPTLSDYGEPPMNGARFDIPVVPGDPSFPRIEFDNGAVFCSSTVIGPRQLLTAGHCVYDGGSFRRNAVVYPGYSDGKPSPTIGSFVARRLIAFSGWTEGHDYAHDVAMIELDRDLPPAIQKYAIQQNRPNCQIVNGFDRHFYLEGNNDQLMNQSMSYIGCKGNQVFFFIGNGHGSSGSSSVVPGTKSIFAVRSNFFGSVGYDTWITPAKRCFLTGRAGTPSC